MDKLPAEILYMIHLYSLSGNLPAISRYHLNLFKHSTLTHRSLYLIYLNPSPSTLLTRSACFPLLTPTLLPHLIKTYNRIWPSIAIHLLSRSGAPPLPTLTCSALPRRLFSPEHGCLDPCLTQALLDLGANPNKHSGYALHQCVLAGDVSGIELLLKAGASPSIKNARSVVLALGKGLGLNVIKLLIEGTRDDWYADGNGAEDQVEEVEVKGKKKRRKSGESGNGRRKRVKREDIVKVDSGLMDIAINMKAWDVVKYFQEKGVVPSLKALKLLHE